MSSVNPFANDPIPSLVLILVNGSTAIERCDGEHRILLRDLCTTMIDGSLCALGGMAPFPVLSVMDHFEEEL